MAVDLMEMVKGAVSKQILGQIGGLLGTDESKTSSAFETIAGSILGGLMKKASTPQGAEVIFESAQKQDDSVLDKLGDLLGGGKSTEQYESAGGNLLETIFGGDHSGVMNVLTKALGLDKNLVGKLLKMAAPIIMSVIGKYMKSKALDATGLSGLLGEQKQFLGNYLPSSLTSDLGIGDMIGNATQNVADAGKSVAQATEKKAGSLMRRLLPLIILLGGAWGIWKFVIVPQVEQSVSDNDSQKLADLRKGTAPMDARANKALTEGFAEITTAMTKVEDETTANNVVKSIDRFNRQFDNLRFDEIEDKSTLSSMILEFIEKMSEQTDKLSDKLKSIVKPAMDALIKKLTPFSN